VSLLLCAGRSENVAVWRGAVQKRSRSSLLLASGVRGSSQARKRPDILHLPGGTRKPPKHGCEPMKHRSPRKHNSPKYPKILRSHGIHLTLLARRPPLFPVTRGPPAPQVRLREKARRLVWAHEHAKAHAPSRDARIQPLAWLRAVSSEFLDSGFAPLCRLLLRASGVGMTLSDGREAGPSARSQRIMETSLPIPWLERRLNMQDRRAMLILERNPGSHESWVKRFRHLLYIGRIHP